MAKRKRKTTTVVVVKCVGACGGTREIKPGEVGKDEVPMCEVCCLPMLVVEAEARTR